MADALPAFQSDDDRLSVILDSDGGCCWQICSGGICLRDRSGPTLMARYQSLRISQGRLTPLS